MKKRCAVAALAQLGMMLLLGLRALALPQEPVPQLQTGTLNLLLANKKGFVIAADSRASVLYPTFVYSDDSQKLFRVGRKSAAVISGFASCVADRSPIDYQVAAVLRDEFSNPEWMSGKRSLTNLPGTLTSRVGEQLSVFGGLLGAEPATLQQLDFQMLAAGFDKGKLVVLKLNFKPELGVWGPFGLSVPRYAPVSATHIVEHFEYLAAGVDDIARAILDEHSTTKDKRILEYYQARNVGKLDNLSLHSLEQLAIAILEETKRSTPVVGGPGQIGVFPRHGSVRWYLPDLPSTKQKFKNTLLNVGGNYSWAGFPLDEYSLMKGKNGFFEVSMSLVYPLDDPFTQVFLGGIVRDVPVLLDGNIFAKNWFINVHFRYNGGPFYLRNNRLDKCWLEIAKGVSPPDNPELKSCTVEPVDKIVQEHAVGSLVRAKPVGCVHRSSNGGVVIKKTGHEQGFDCKDSRIEGPMMGPFQLGPGAPKSPAPAKTPPTSISPMTYWNSSGKCRMRPSGGEG